MATFLSLCLVASAGCTSQSQTPTEVPEVVDSWSSSELSMEGRYTVDMPPFDVREIDRMRKYSCFFAGENRNLYCFDLSSYTYSTGVIDSTTVIESGVRAVETSTWFIERAWSKMDNENIVFELGTTQEVTINDIGVTSLEAMVSNKRYVGYWVNLGGTQSKLWLTDEGSVKMLEIIMQSIRRG